MLGLRVGKVVKPCAGACEESCKGAFRGEMEEEREVEELYGMER